MPFTFLDVPYADDVDSISYLADQLRQLAKTLEERTGRKFQEEQLKEILRTENETRAELMKFFDYQKTYYYPGELISHLYMMMGMHLLIGTREFLDLIRFMNEEIQKAPLFEGKRILWIHLMPFYQESLKNILTPAKIPDYRQRYHPDFMEELDAEHPFEALARKIIKNLYNGSYAYKAKMIGQLADHLKPDAVIHFCHWGCKQASGGSVLLKENAGNEHSHADSGWRRN